MRRSSMRRGSAVLLSILPLLAPTYALPTYLGNEATVSHMNVERAAVPEPAFDLGAPESEPIMRQEKRQSSSSESTAGTELDSENIGWGGQSQSQSEGVVRRPLTAGRSQYVPNIASYGSDAWLGTAKRDMEERDIEEREAAPEAKPAVTLDLDYVPPTYGYGRQNLGAPV
ncbi:MAG: hypothetical protein Q9171_002040 [Xanthocarpia ochracea]